MNRFTWPADHSMAHSVQRVAPSPETLKAMRQEFEALVMSASPGLRAHLHFGESHAHQVGYSDGVIYPPDDLPESALALAADEVPSAAPASPGPVRGVVRVIVLLVDFPDHSFTTAKAHFDQFLFSDGLYTTGSLREYYTAASYGKVFLTGEIHGPYRLPQPYTFYTDARSGTGMYPHNAQRMAEDAIALAQADVDFSRFDPNRDGYVDALTITHAGPGAEAIPSSDRAHHIWSHKWVLNRRLTYDGTHLYAYLTVPEDGRLGVYAHELGHLLFQWPDLYDTDYSSSGLGNWCLMSGGSWNNAGSTPALPCAWCKMTQGWTDTAVPVSSERIQLPRSSDHQRIWKLWTGGRPRAEYFLLENRQRHGFDRYLPGEGLMIYHIDETQAANSQEPHYKVGLEQADGLLDLEEKADGGDEGDPYPGSATNRTFDAQSRPSSRSHSNVSTRVSVREISDSGTIMSAAVNVDEEPTTTVFSDTPNPPEPQGNAAGRSVTEVLGIGTTRAARLAAIGIQDLLALSRADPALVAETLGISRERAVRFVDAAGQLLSH